MTESIESSEHDMLSAVQRISFGRVFPEQGVGHGLDAFNRRLVEYLKRSLSYELDTLNGFKGILREFEESSTAFYSFVGLPILAGDTSMTATLMQVLSLSTSLKGVQRRKRFPSWSWSGWTRPEDALLQVQFDEQMQLGFRRDMFEIPLISATIDFGKAGVFDWENQWREVMYIAQCDTRIPRLFIEGWLVEFEVDGSGSLAHRKPRSPFIKKLLEDLLKDPVTKKNISLRLKMDAAPVPNLARLYQLSWIFVLAKCTRTFAETLVLIKDFSKPYFECVVRRLDLCPEIINRVIAGSELPSPFRYDRIWLS